VRRALILAGAITLLAALAVAAPALPVKRYRPEPVHFELSAPREGLGSAAAAGFVSEELRAPKRFNLVGFEWEGGAEPRIAVRTRAEGEAWSAWTPLPAASDGAPDPHSSERSARGVSQPVWAGEADYVQYRMSRHPPGLRLHFINTTGTATALDRIETGLRGALSDAVTAVASLTSASAEDGRRRPKMISRRRWGAEESCKPRATPGRGEVKMAFVHHTVNTNTYGRAEAKSMVLAICRYHRNQNGWNDIGYNFLVDRFGRIFEGRDGGVRRAIIGAHAEGFNAQSTGVAALGTYITEPLSRPGVRGVARLIRWKLKQHGTRLSGRPRLTSGGGSTNLYPAGATVRFRRISGHRDASATECPGDELYRQLRPIRKRVRR
jgi:uncharacterized protein with LGFP repeats